MPYPDDLDDTFVALAALYGYDPKLIGGTVLANVAKILTGVEAREGGPYRTWLVGADSNDKWRDVDVVANSNVGYFLSLLGVELPNLRSLIEEAVANGKFSSPYYPGVIQVAYFVSRFYKTGKCSRAIADLVLAERARRELNPLESALAISALIELGLGDEIGAGEADRLTRVASEGEWKPYAFCIDPSRGGKTRYAGSAALTAAFVAEALVKYSEIGKLGNAESKQFADLDILEGIKSLARERCNLLPENLKQVARRQIETTKDKEIAMLPYRFHRALGKLGGGIAPEKLESLALANLYGWMAYTVYDDFLDGEGRPLLLSAANYFLRELTALYASLGEEFLRLYKNLMNTIDGANVWEQLHCRVTVKDGIATLPRDLPFQTVANLADRSVGHALPAVALLLEIGCPAESIEVKQLLAFFRDYLIARQLHDDAHDWKEDLSRGQLNSVGARLLRSWKKGAPARQSDTFNLGEDIPELQRLFWRSEIETVIADIRSYLALARASLGQLKILENPAGLEELLEKLDKAAEKTLSERALASDFLRQYKI